MHMKGPIMLWDLESQISILENYLKTVTDQLVVSETLKKDDSQVNEMLLQLQAANEIVNTLRSDVVVAMEAYNTVVNEKNIMKVHVDIQRSYIDHFKRAKRVDPQKSSEGGDASEVNELKKELEMAKTEVSIVKMLRTALESLEMNFNQERSRNIKEVECAGELLKKFKAESALREAEMKEELSKANAVVDELKSNLMDKETELQAISEENEKLNKMLEKCESGDIDQTIEAELAKLKRVGQMKAQLMDKETKLKNALEENETLKLEISKRDVDKSARFADLEVVQAAMVEATTKLGCIMKRW